MSALASAIIAILFVAFYSIIELILRRWKEARAKARARTIAANQAWDEQRKQALLEVRKQQALAEQKLAEQKERDALELKNRPEAWVYFIRAGEFIKIGIATDVGRVRFLGRLGM